MKKIVSLVLVVLMAIGCISFATADEDTSLYLSDETVEFTLLMRGDANVITQDDFWFFDFCEKFLNVKFDVQAVDSSVFKEKLATMMAGGDMPDMMMCSATLGGADVYQYGAEDGILLKLDEYKEYAPNFWSILDDQAWLKPVLTSKDGHMYGFSNIRINNGESMGIFTVTNVQWLENLGLDMPTTLDEFHDMLIAFRDEDANGNGDPTDEIPWEASWQSGYPEPMFVGWAFGLNGYWWDTFDVTTKEGYYAPYAPQYKDIISFIKQCWDEGLIQDTFFSGDNSSNCAFGQSNTDNTYYGFSVDVHPTELTSNPDLYECYMAQIPVIADESIERTTWKGLPLDLYTWTINAKCENPEVAVKFCDFWYDPYWAVCYAYGPEYGTEYDLYDNGWSYDYETQKFSYPTNTDNQTNFGHYHNTIMDGANFGLETGTAERMWNTEWHEIVDEETKATFGYKFNQSLLTNNAPYEVLQPLDFAVMTPEQNETYSTYSNACTTYFKAQMPLFITGERSMDEWDDFLAELDAKGGQEMNNLVKELVADYFSNAN